MEQVKRSGRGGRRPGAGRPRGSRNRKPIVLADANFPAASTARGSKLGVETLEAIARDPAQPAASRVNAARALLALPIAQPKSPSAPEQDQPGEIIWLKRES